MGYMTELNTLIGLPKDFDVTILSLEKRYRIMKERERTFPLHIAMLVVDGEWNFYGYGVAHSIVVKGQTTEIEFEMLSLFTPDEQKNYKDKFVAAGRKTGEVR
ncbi:hypothetical protein COS78_04100 [Candidatus Shapirobacteria bacterium CG06_land_8_20_14_3_00_40_12]|uniref:Uncharacterized protein n=3 Tax=Candidatus Shapironibacteriota TaxID=1752721 RepID=A0A2M7TTX6_9BACT|nr:MAG: hypothetical protein COS78_04100 [Candidatus Shapirobacteria bacterium CG06_land_8_20_14_3_00_40_12]PIZ60835.1 MAG: hypothetical protein COY20_00825 [Candidatus Shapirobacteria bacterium CG_4_10_14_0_2_um_filter_40_12]PJA50939.1 MAG: hypothetical protein CO168_02470 [Candidatus Shapirobacteria bacterium CG_4_9_14_3_um_filter_36_12]